MTSTIEKSIDESVNADNNKICENDIEKVLAKNSTWGDLSDRYMLALRKLQTARFTRKSLFIFFISFILPLISPVFISAAPSLVILYVIFESEFSSLSLFEISNLSIMSGIMYFISVMFYSTSLGFVLIAIAVSIMTILYSLIYSFISRT